MELWFLLKKKKVGKGREREKIKISFRSVSTRLVIENSKRMAKKFKTLKNTNMGSFQAKTVCKRPGKRENKNCFSVPFLPDA